MSSSQRPGEDGDVATDAAYDRFADEYRAWWAPVIAPATVTLLDHIDGLHAATGATLLDIGSGTGTLAVAALRRWPRIRAVAVDPARTLLRWAEADAREAGVDDRLEVRVGEAGSLPVADETVEVAASSFVLQLLEDRAAGVREGFRVLRPAGVFAHLTWRVDEEPFEPDEVFDDVLDDLGITPPERPDGGAGESYASAEEAERELLDHGFTGVRARDEWLVHRFTPRSFVQVAEHWTEDDTFLGVDEPMRHRLREEVARRLERLDPDALVWRRPLVSAVGRRPG